MIMHIKVKINRAPIINDKKEFFLVLSLIVATAKQPTPGPTYSGLDSDKRSY